MKLIVVTAIREFEEDLRNLLIECEVGAFSSTELSGFRSSELSNLKDNWFGAEKGTHASVLLFAFVPDEQTEQVFEKIEKYNQIKKTQSKVHILVLNIEKSN